jgi:L-rhamnose isomerase
MTLSDVAAREIAKVLRKHVGMKELEQVVTELVEIPGDKDFRDSIERLVHALRMVSDR